MDWNHDGKVDGRDAMLYHEVIAKDNSSSGGTSSSTSGGGSYRHSTKQTNQTPPAPTFEISQLGGIVLGLLAFLIIAFIFMGSGFSAIWNLIEIGVIVFFIAQWLDS